jgi:CheY-like chemotaxis protein
MSLAGIRRTVATEAELEYHLEPPIMFVTASVQRGDVARFAEHGAAGYLAKPFTP